MAARRGVTFEQAREPMLALPGVEEGSSYGTPGFRVKGRLLSRLREEDVLVLRPLDDIEQRFLMSTDPAAFFQTEHYRGSTAILVRLSEVRLAQLGEIIEQSWRRLAPKKLVAAYDASHPQPGTTRSRSGRSR